MQAKKLQRFERPLYLMCAIFFAFSLSMIFTPHTYAANYGKTSVGATEVLTANGFSAWADNTFQASASDNVVSESFYVSASTPVGTHIQFFIVNSAVSTGPTGAPFAMSSGGNCYATATTTSTNYWLTANFTGCSLVSGQYYAIGTRADHALYGRYDVGDAAVDIDYRDCGNAAGPAGIGPNPSCVAGVDGLSCFGNDTSAMGGTYGGIHSCQYFFNSQPASMDFNAAGSYHPLSLYVTTGIPSPSLTFSRVGGSGSVLTGVPVSFSGSLANGPAGFNHAFFWTSIDAYPNAADANGNALVQELVGSGAISQPLVFSHTFTTAGSYSPVLLYTNCTLAAYTTAGSGCDSLLATINPADTTATTLTVTSPASNGLKNKFSTPLSTVKVGDKVGFSYSLDSNICKYGAIGDHGTVSGVYFFSGEDINVMAGSGTTAHSNFSYTYVQAGLNSLGVAQPYLSIVCSTDTAAWTDFKQPTLNVYLGGSLYAASAQSLDISALGVTDIPILQNGDYANGGQSENFGTGTGHNFLFSSDVFTAAQGQTINLHIKYFVPYTVGNVYLHTDVTNDVNNPPLIGTGSSKGKDIYTPIRYGEAGIMKPWIEVRSASFNPSDPSTYDIFYLGGTTNISLAKNIIITNQVATTATNFLDSDGIFGLNASAFTVSFGNSQNIFIQWANALATIMVQAALSVAGIGWHIIRISPIFSFIDQSFHPVSGSVHTLPPKIFNQPVAFTPADATFTIAYASETDSSMIKWFIHIFITVEIMWFVLGSLFPIKQDVRRH
jgi:hypothetical protein